MRLTTTTTTTTTLIAAMSAILPASLGAASSNYDFVVGTWGAGPKYCEPSISPGAEFVYIDMSRFCRDYGLGNCCVTYALGSKTRPSLKKRDIQDLEELVHHEARHPGPYNRMSEAGVWHLERSDYEGAGQDVTRELVDAYNAGIRSVAKDREILKLGGKIEFAVFARGNETVGEERTVVKKTRSKR